MTGTTEGLRPSDVLDHAANLIDEWGWARSHFVGSKGAMCHLGAINAAAGFHVHEQNGDGTWDFRVRDVAGEGRLAYEAQAYDRRVTADPAGYQTITGWNDTACKSKREAVAKLREAAELARSEGR